MCKRKWDEVSPLDPGAAVGRKKRVSEYHIARMKGLDEYDRLASMILAAVFSSTSDPTSERQLWVQQCCVAVCKDGTNFFVGVNYLSKSSLLSRDVVTTVSTLSGDHGVNLASGSTVILAGEDDKHAEMKIVEALYKKHGGTGALAGRMIGVSKPCCPKCKDVLDTHGCRYSYFHNDQPKNWTAPDLS